MKETRLYEIQALDCGISLRFRIQYSCNSRASVAQLTLVVQLVQSGQGSDDRQPVRVGVRGVTARVLRQPQDLQVTQTPQMPELTQRVDVVASQVEFAEMLTGRDVLQRRDVVRTESRERDVHLYSAFHNTHHLSPHYSLQ